MDLIPLSHKISLLLAQYSVLDTYLMKSDLIDCIHDTIQLSDLAHKSGKFIKPEVLASMWNISLENAIQKIDNAAQRHV